MSAESYHGKVDEVRACRANLIRLKRSLRAERRAKSDTRRKAEYLHRFTSSINPQVLHNTLSRNIQRDRLEKLAESEQPKRSSMVAALAVGVGVAAAAFFVSHDDTRHGVIRGF